MTLRVNLAIMTGMKFLVSELEAKVGDKLYTVTEAAKMLDVSRQTINTWVRDGRFPNNFSVGTDDKTLIPASDIEEVRKEEAVNGRTARPAARCKR